jgi:DNA replication protein DnaC
MTTTRTPSRATKSATPDGLYEQIKADLGYLGLNAAASSFATLADQARVEQWTHVEFLARLIAEQATADRDRRSSARLRYARFPYLRRVEDFDFEFQPSVDRKLVEDLATLRFVTEGRPILFLGQPGCGKTHLAVALAIAAVEAGWRGYFTTADNLCKTLQRAQHDGTFTAKLKTYTAPTVLVIDDVGLLPITSPDGPAVFFHVVNTRYERGLPTIVTTNRGLPAWGQIFGDAVVAAAILDRLMHKAIVFNIKGPSWRLREHNGLEIATREPDR